jgi:triacylglycerol lipase
MLSARSAGVPLNLGFDIVKTIDGENDGLVAVESMPWGESFLFVEPSGKRGISHADMIDQTRKDIRDFDVCELYVGIVQRLKERGL